MKKIQLSTLRADLAMMKAGVSSRPMLGGNLDAATAFMMAADSDALATRLMNCAFARLAQANVAVWGTNPVALFYNPPAALNQSVRALYLIEKACEAKQFSERMLGAALVFEEAGYMDIEAIGYPNYDVLARAEIIWNDFVAEGIFDTGMYDGIDSNKFNAV